MIVYRDSQRLDRACAEALGLPIRRGSRDWTISGFTYVDCLMGSVHAISDRGDDEGQAGGFYHDDGDLLGCDLATGYVWWGELSTTRSSEWVFEIDGLRGHLIDATVWSRGKQLVVRYATEQAIL